MALQSLVAGLGNVGGAPRMAAMMAQGAQTGEMLRQGQANRQQQQFNQNAYTAEQDEQKQMRTIQYANGLAKQLKKTPMEQRQALLEPQIPALQKLGIPADSLYGVSDQELDGFIAKTDPLVSNPELDYKNRALDANINQFDRSQDFREESFGQEMDFNRDQLGLNQQKLALDALNAKSKSGEDDQKQINTLRKDVNSFTKDLRGVDVAYRKIKASSKKPSAAGDLALIFNFMKLLDPGSTVREGEFANAQNAGGAFNRVGALYNNVKSGQRLTEEQRADFLSQTEGLYESQMSGADSQIASVISQAEQDNINPERILGSKPYFEYLQRQDKRNRQGGDKGEEYSLLKSELGL